MMTSVYSRRTPLLLVAVAAAFVLFLALTGGAGAQVATPTATPAAGTPAATPMATETPAMVATPEATATPAATVLPAATPAAGTPVPSPAATPGRLPETGGLPLELLIPVLLGAGAAALAAGSRLRRS